MIRIGIIRVAQENLRARPDRVGPPARHAQNLATLAMNSIRRLPLLALAGFAAFATCPSHAGVQGWLHWRGPQQNGTSLEKNIPTQLALDGPLHLWTVDLSGQSTATRCNRSRKAAI